MRYINATTKKYPVSESDIRALFPETAFPAPFVPPEPYKPVSDTVQTYDPIKEYLVEAAPALTKDGRYEQRYTVTALPADAIAANTAAQTARITQEFEFAIQKLLDTSAQARRYDSISTAISYAEEPAVPKFQNDGKAFRAWRSLVWAYAYQQLELVMSGKRAQPTVEDFLSELPALELPA